MDFNFNDDQMSLCRAVQRWVDKGYDFSRRKRIVDAGGFSRDTWNDFNELGLLGLVVPHDRGGMGLGAVEAMVVMEELGRGLVIEPFAEGALVSTTALMAAPPDVQAAWLPRIADGSALVVLACRERGVRYVLAPTVATAVATADGWLVSGEKSLVAAGDHADAFIVPARAASDADGAMAPGLFLVERTADGVRTRGYQMQDGGRAAEVGLRQARATLLVPPGEGLAVLEKAMDVGIAAVCAEAVGAMERLVAMTVDYMSARKQFGVPIATFQALRHRIADVKMQLELARSMSYFATLKLNEPAPQRRRALSQAKVQLGGSMRFVGQQCIQLHGAIGITDECLASHYFKRLTCIELTYGDTLHHLGEVSARMLDTAGVFD